MVDIERLAQRLIGGKDEVWIEGRWFYKEKYMKIDGEWVLSLHPHRDRCRIAMPHIEMKNDPPEYEFALQVIKRVKQLKEEV